MKFEIKSVWDDGQDCLKKYKKALEPFHPEVETSWEHFDHDRQARKRQRLFIELNDLNDLLQLVKRVDNNVIISYVGQKLEIYDDWRE